MGKITVTPCDIEGLYVIFVGIGSYSVWLILYYNKIIKQLYQILKSIEDLGL